MAIEHLHWFLREECNAYPRCSYCFGPGENNGYSEERDVQMAQILVDGGIKRVTLTGGEPTLAGSLNEVARVLKTGGARVSLHTNGLLLNPSMLDNWGGLIDDISLPIDSFDPEIQKALRSEIFVEKVSGRLMDLTREIIRRGIGVGYHTVFTSVNNLEIPKIYRQIRKEPFSYWRIYEYIDDLAEREWQKSDGNLNDQSLTSEGFVSLNYPGLYKLGEDDGLAADFLLMEDRMKKYGDERVQFVARDDRGYYCFLRPDGMFAYYTDHSTDRRETLGSIFDDGLPAIQERWNNMVNGDPTDEDVRVFFEREGQKPFWLRQWLGRCWMEEIDEIDGRAWPKIEHLVELWETRKSSVRQ
jgi:MoaA/NifB/PqqE/SkfB family radical SAM enzyme